MKLYPPLANCNKNLLLAGMDSEQLERLGQFFEAVYLEYGQVLFEPGSDIQDIYFPEDCLVSLVGILNMRTSLEVGLIGYEGVVGLAPGILQSQSGAHTQQLQTRAIVQKAGKAIKISSQHMSAEYKNNPAFQSMLFEYTQRFLAQTIQIAVCSKFHMVEARLARSLLTTRDHLQSIEFHLTHEFIAHSLGVRRVGVTKAASALQRRDLISYTRGQIKILDEAGLASVSCECYQIIKHINEGKK